MSDREPEQDPEQERIRSLLAGLGSGAEGRDEPLPPEVAARLDATLADLTAERGTSNVVPLRRRWGPRLAAGAAAVIVLGLGGLTVANLGHLGSDDSATSSDAGGSTALKEQGPAASDSEGGDTGVIMAAGTLTSARFEEGVRSVLQQYPDLRPPSRLSADAQGRAPRVSPGASPPAMPDQDFRARCPGPTVSDGSRSAYVDLDGQPAVLVVHPAKGTSRLVEAWNCDGTRRLASTTLAP